jgi:hypothetical protein
MNHTKLIMAVKSLWTSNLFGEKHFFFRIFSEHSVPVIVVIPPGQDRRDWNDLLRADGISRTRKVFKEEMKKSENW